MYSTTSQSAFSAQQFGKCDAMFSSIKSCAICLLILMGILIGLSSFVYPATASLRTPVAIGSMSAEYVLTSELAVTMAVLFTLYSMRRLDKRPFADLNFGRYPQVHLAAAGCIVAAFALSVIIGILYVSGFLDISRSQIASPLLIHDGPIWAMSFVLTGICEEAVFRGYLLRRLEDGFGFWPGTAAVSILFAFVHAPNHGETPVGLTVCGLFSVLMAICVRFTGTIWFAAGFHCAWDWLETFFFGAPNSGVCGTTHLLTSIPHGRSWISGGATGPEGSVVSLVLVVIAILCAQLMYRRFVPRRSSIASPIVALDHMKIRK